jgi:hypothetical protein
MARALCGWTGSAARLIQGLGEAERDAVLAKGVRAGFEKGRGTGRHVPLPPAGRGGSAHHDVSAKREETEAMREGMTTRMLGMTSGALLLGLLAMPPAALANLPLGACCFANGSCQDLMVTQCDFQNADFIGAGTSCRDVDCAAPMAVPVLSIAGLIAALGGLAALGLYRLTIGRRAA